MGKTRFNKRIKIIQNKNTNLISSLIHQITIVFSFCHCRSLQNKKTKKDSTVFCVLTFTKSEYDKKAAAHYYTRG